MNQTEWLLHLSQEKTNELSRHIELAKRDLKLAEVIPERLRRAAAYYACLADKFEGKPISTQLLKRSDPDMFPSEASSR